MFKAHTYHLNVLIRVLLTAMIALLFLNAVPSWGQALPSQNNPTFFTTSPRIVTLYQGATDSAVALGLTPVGVVDSWLEKPTYRYLRAPLEGVEHVGLETQPNLEKIAWLQPDLVMASDFRHARIAPLLTAIAGSILTELGFEQPETLQSQSWGMKLSSTENIPVLDADVIFVLLEPNDPAIVDNYQHWTAHPLWQQLAAVQSGRVFEVDPVSWMMGGGILAANAMLDDLYSHYGLDETIVANRDACSLDAYRQVDQGIC